LSLPAPEAGWLEEFSAGLTELASVFRVALIGGDTVRGPLSVTVTVLGRVSHGSGVRRGSASPGDGAWVTGTPGDAVAGRLSLDESADASVAGDALRSLRTRFLYPSPRVQAGLALAGLASSMIDVSDGLHVDLGRLLGARGAELDVGAL